MKVLILGDSQLDANLAFDRLDESGRSVRFQENLKTFSQIIHDGHDAGCGALVHLGDLSERKNMSALELESAATMFRIALNLGMDIYAVCGNHDMSFYEVSSSNFAALGIAFGDRFHVAHRPTYWPDLNAVALPYMHKASREDIRAAVKAAANAAPPKTALKPTLFAHYGVTGAVVGPNNMTVASDALTSEDIPWDDFRQAFCGHYHNYQEVRVRGVRARFPGSLWVNNFGERHDAKGYYIFDTNSHKDDALWTPSPKTRDWVQVDSTEVMDAVRVPWKAGDIVKVTGQCVNKLGTETGIRDSISSGLLPEPFAIKFELTEVSQRVTRGDDYVDLGITQAVKKLVAERAPSAEVGKAAEDLILANIRESSVPVFGANVYLKSLTATDFMTYDSLSYDFVREPVLVSGENGIGKTNFSEAVLFALTGEVSKPIPKDNLIRQGEKEAKVKLVLTNDSGEELWVERKLKRTKTGATQDLSAGPDKALSDGGIREIQARLDAVLGTSFNGLRAANFLFQKDRDPLVFADPADRKRVLGDALNHAPLRKAADALNKVRVLADSAVTKAEQELAVSEAFLEGMDKAQWLENIEADKGSLDLAKGTIPPLRAFKDVRAKAVDDLRNQLTGITAELDALPNVAADLAAVEASLAAGEKNYEAVKAAKLDELSKHRARLAEIKALVSVLAGLRERVEKATQDLSDAEASLSVAQEAREAVGARLAALGAQIQPLEDRVEKWERLEGVTECSECGTPLTAEHAKAERDKLSSELEALGNKQNSERVALYAKEEILKAERAKVSAAKTWLDSSRAELSRVETLLAEAPRAEKAVEDTILAGQNNKKAWEASRTELGAKKAVLDMAIANNTSKRYFLQSERTRLTADLSAAQAELGEANTALVAAETRMAETEARIARAENELKKFDAVEAQIGAQRESLAKLKADAEVKALATEVVGAKEGLSLLLIDSVTPFLESRANGYIAQLGMGELKISLSTLDGDKSSLLVLVDNGGPTPLDIGAYSGGQLGRVEICLKQALADLIASSRGTKLQFLFLDEPTDGLDGPGKQALLDFIYARSSDRFASTMVVSHDDRLLHAFQNRLVVRKKSNGATCLEAC